MDDALFSRSFSLNVGSSDILPCQSSDTLRMGLWTFKRLPTEPVSRLSRYPFIGSFQDANGVLGVVGHPSFEGTLQKWFACRQERRCYDVLPALGPSVSEAAARLGVDRTTGIPPIQ